MLSVYRACRHLFLVVSHFLFGRIWCIPPKSYTQIMTMRRAQQGIDMLLSSIMRVYGCFIVALVMLWNSSISWFPQTFVSDHVWPQTSGVSSHSVLLLYVFDDSCNFPVLFQVQNLMSKHHLVTTVQWLDSRGMFLVIISLRKGSLSLFSGYIVKLSEGWISFSVDKKTEADETSGILLRFFGDTANRKQTSCFGFPIFLQYGT